MPPQPHERETYCPHVTTTGHHRLKVMRIVHCTSHTVLQNPSFSVGCFEVYLRNIFLQQHQKKGKAVLFL